MPRIPTRFSRFLVAVIILCLPAQFSFAASLYHVNVTVGSDGKPSSQLTNDSQLPIFAFIMVEFPSLGMEGRTYYDFYVNHREQPIAPGSSITRGLSYFHGAEVKVRAEVRAVVFQDGTSDGDPVWVNAILAQRLRLYDRLRSVHELLEKQVDTRISREGILQMLRHAQLDAEKQSPDDDLKPVDSAVFYGAISTFDKNRQAPVGVVLERYLANLRLRIAHLERSRPTMDIIRTLPVTTPRPLSEGSLPADFRAALASSNAVVVAATSSLSSCTVLPYDSNAEATPSLTCLDSTGDRVTYVNHYTFQMTFSQYNASTKTTKDVSWSSAAKNPPWTAYGQCVSFIDCDGAQDVFYVQGTATGEADANRGILPGSAVLTVKQGQNAEPFYWMVDNYPSPTFSQCDECDPYPENQYNPVSTNAPVPSTHWSFNYACVVSP
jgi:hypothetical protein